MSQTLPFQIRHFDNYCDELERVGIDPGYVLYTNHHASNGQPATRFLPSAVLELAETYVASPSDQTFMALVAKGVFFDTEWDRNTRRWAIISFKGWEVLHSAFVHLLGKADHTLIDISGLSSLELTEIAGNGY